MALWPIDKLTASAKPKVDALICSNLIISKSSRLQIAALDAPKLGQGFVCWVRFVNLQSCGPYSSANRARTSLPFICVVCSPTVDGVRCFVQSGD